MAEYNKKWADLFPATIGNQGRPADGVDNTLPYETDKFPQHIANDPVRYDKMNAVVSQSMSNDERLNEKINRTSDDLAAHNKDPKAHATGIAGNAATASKLASPRTISLSGKAAGSTTFDGSGDAAIKVTSVNADTANKLSTARKINITGNATGAAAFDGSSDISINVNVSQSAHSDTADTATKLETARTISLAGNATGSATFDGTCDITIDTTVAEAAHADKATNDGAGDEITTKYVSSVTIDNATLTVTKGDKTATELTLPSYTHPNSGISAGLDEWTGITFDAQGHATATTYPTRLSAYNHVNSNIDFRPHYKDESQGLQNGGYFLDGAALPDDGSWIKILTNLDYFDTGHSLGGNGYQKFRSGLILQWGTRGSGGVGYYWINFPISFNACFIVVTSYNSGSAKGDYRAVCNISNTGCSVATDNCSTHWLAIGC